MLTNFDASIQVAIIGAIVACLAKIIDVILKRGQTAKEQRDELRAEIQAAKDDAKGQIQRRREAEEEVERLREKLHRRDRDLEDAENGARLFRELKYQIPEWKSGYELRIERLERDNAELVRENERLRLRMRDARVADSAETGRPRSWELPPAHDGSDEDL